jgi:hypothetical protein
MLIYTSAHSIVYKDEEESINKKKAYIINDDTISIVICRVM